MRLHHVLDKVVGHEIKAGILRILCEKNTGWTGRQIAKELAVSPTTAGKFLQELVGEGIVVMKGVGRSYLYHVNDKSYIVKNILLPFFEKEKNILTYISVLIKKAVVASGAGVESIVIFGSVASKTETARSDLDIAVIVSGPGDKEKAKRAVDGVSDLVAREFHAVISPLIMSIDEFRKRHERKAALVLEMMKSYTVIHGKPLERLVV